MTETWTKATRLDDETIVDTEIAIHAEGERVVTTRDVIYRLLTEAGYELIWRSE